jgi:hypothetical protein
VPDDVETLDILWRADNAFRQAEADRKVLKIGRRGHHDGVRGAVVDERDRHLGRNGAGMVTDAARRNLDRADRNGGVGHGYSAACSGAMRRLDLEKAW